MKLRLALALALALGTLSCATTSATDGGEGARTTAAAAPCNVQRMRNQLRDIEGGDPAGVTAERLNQGQRAQTLRALARDAGAGAPFMEEPASIIECRVMSMRANLLLTLLPPEAGQPAATSHPNLRAAGEQAQLGTVSCEPFTDPEGQNATVCELLRFYSAAIPARQALDEIEHATPSAEARSAGPAANELWTTLGQSMIQVHTLASRAVSGDEQPAEMRHSMCRMWGLATPLLAWQADGEEGRALKRANFTNLYYRSMGAAAQSLGLQTQSPACGADANSVECAQAHTRSMENSCAQ